MAGLQPRLSASHVSIVWRNSPGDGLALRERDGTLLAVLWSTELRQLIAGGGDIPEWITFLEVAEILRSTL